MTNIKVQFLSKNYRKNQKNIPALSDINLSFEPGTCTILLGPIGCGQTTLLRILSGLEKPTVGSIHIPRVGGKRLTLGFVFKEPRLMPWLTVLENICLNISPTFSSSNIKEIISKLKLSGLERSYPKGLSPDMAQRVSLARTFCQNPDIILLDEPFSELDYLNRISLQEDLADFFRQEKKTLIFATHDVEEAAFLGQRVTLMNKGKIISDYPMPIEHQHHRFGDVATIVKRNLLEALKQL